MPALQFFISTYDSFFSAFIFNLGSYYLPITICQPKRHLFGSRKYTWIFQGLRPLPPALQHDVMVSIGCYGVMPSAAGMVGTQATAWFQVFAGLPMTQDCRKATHLYCFVWKQRADPWTIFILMFSAAGLVSFATWVEACLGNQEPWMHLGCTLGHRGRGRRATCGTHIKSSLILDSFWGSMLPAF